mmetsp:Transcript_16274/g.45137  ORF Transcript_16274/g.45137 Transcript_16274/m.45137 type:complete len:214 (-) Transcript_16274:1126-1767(-)
MSTNQRANEVLPSNVVHVLGLVHNHESTPATAPAAAEALPTPSHEHIDYDMTGGDAIVVATTAPIASTRADGDKKFRRVYQGILLVLVAVAFVYITVVIAPTVSPAIEVYGDANHTPDGASCGFPAPQMLHRCSQHRCQRQRQRQRHHHWALHSQRRPHQRQQQRRQEYLRGSLQHRHNRCHRHKRHIRLERLLHRRYPGRLSIVWSLRCVQS